MISSTCVLYQILASGSEKKKKKHVSASQISILHKRLKLLKLQTRPVAFIAFRVFLLTVSKHPEIAGV